jgi:hypothetical protein
VRVERAESREEIEERGATRSLFSSLLSTLSSLLAFGQSGRQDLNLRPSGPKPDALAKLSYAPGRKTVPRCFQGVNGETPAEDGGFTHERLASGAPQTVKQFSSIVPGGRGQFFGSFPFDSRMAAENPGKPTKRKQGT